MGTLRELLDRLNYELNPSIIEEVIRELPQANRDPEVSKLLVSALDGMRDALLRLNQAELGKRLAEAALEYARNSGDRLLEAFVEEFLAEMLAGMGDRSRINVLREAFEKLKGVESDDEIFSYTLLRTGIHLARRYESAGRIEEFLKVVDDVFRLLAKANVELLKGDAHVLILSAKALEHGYKDTELVRRVLERTGFLQGDRLRVPTFVLAMFHKDMQSLAEKLGARIVFR